MTIYDAIGLTEGFICEDIPVDTLKQQLLSTSMSYDAEKAFSNVEKVTLKTSIERNQEYLHVIEVEISKATNIELICTLIQRLIKYRVLFVFVYDERYLVSWRSFKMTESTENVNSSSMEYCTGWIYKEQLVPDILYAYEVSPVAESKSVKISRDIEPTAANDGKAVFFEDLFRNVKYLENYLRETDLYCERYVQDWLKGHSPGQYISYADVARQAAEEEFVTFIDEIRYFERSPAERIIEELTDTMYKVSINSFGRYPWTYFEGVIDPVPYNDQSYCPWMDGEESFW